MSDPDISGISDNKRNRERSTNEKTPENKVPKSDSRQRKDTEGKHERKIYVFENLVFDLTPFKDVYLSIVNRNKKQMSIISINYDLSKGPSTIRFRPPIADLFRDNVHPLPPLHRGPTRKSENC